MGEFFTRNWWLAFAGAMFGIVLTVVIIVLPLSSSLSACEIEESSCDVRLEVYEEELESCWNSEFSLLSRIGRYEMENRVCDAVTVAQVESHVELLRRVRPGLSFSLSCLKGER